MMTYMKSISKTSLLYLGLGSTSDIYSVMLNNPAICTLGREIQPEGKSVQWARLGFPWRIQTYIQFGLFTYPRNADYKQDYLKCFWD